RRPVTEVGLVEGDVAERGAGPGRRVTAQIGSRAVLLAAEAACDPGADGPVFAKATFDRDPQAGIEGVLVGLGAIACGAFAGEPATAQVAADLPAGVIGRRGGQGDGSGRQAGDDQQRGSAGD